MKTIDASTVTPDTRAWLWTDHGDGILRPCQYFRADGWIVCGLTSHSDFLTCSFCVCDDSPCYVFETDEEREQYTQARRQLLAENHARWAEEEALRRAEYARPGTLSGQ